MKNPLEGDNELVWLGGFGCMGVIFTFLVVIGVMSLLKWLGI